MDTFHKVAFSPSLEASAGTPTPFANYEEQRAALADPQYATSESYRTLVAQRITLTSQIADGEQAHAEQAVVDLIGEGENQIAAALGPDTYMLIGDDRTVLSTTFEITRAMKATDPVTGQNAYAADERYRARVQAAIMRGQGFPANGFNPRRGVVRHVVTHEAHQASLDAIEVEKDARRKAAQAIKPLTLGEPK